MTHYLKGSTNINYSTWTVGARTKWHTQYFSSTEKDCQPSILGPMTVFFNDEKEIMRYTQMKEN